MRRIIIILTVLCLVLLLCACGDTAPESAISTPEVTESVNTQSGDSSDSPFSNLFSGDYEINTIEPVTAKDAIIDFKASSADLHFDEIFKSSSSGIEFEIDDFEPSELEAMKAKTVDLLMELQTAFLDAGLAVSINSATGEAMLDSTVLFDNDVCELSDAGKAFLDSFIKAYTDVIFDEKYDGFISEVVVEGHTDTNGSYEHNLELSQKRADSVMNYCIESATPYLSGNQLSALKDLLRAEGFSYDRPITDPAGNVDMAASRRVCFRFYIAL